MNGAAKLMLEAWYWMPAALILDLMIYHAIVHWLDDRFGE